METIKNLLINLTEETHAGITKAHMKTQECDAELALSVRHARTLQALNELIEKDEDGELSGPLAVDPRYCMDILEILNDLLAISNISAKLGGHLVQLAKKPSDSVDSTYSQHTNKLKEMLHQSLEMLVQLNTAISDNYHPPIQATANDKLLVN